MNLFNAIMIAFHGINRHRLRGFLSVLGVIVGVIAVIGMGALAVSMKKAMTMQAGSMGANTFTIERVNEMEAGMQWVSGDREAALSYWKRPRMELEYVDEIRENCPSVKSVAPYANLSQRFRHRRNRSDESMQIIATNQDFLQGGMYKLAEGRFLTESDIRSRRYICVIGKDIVEQFFPNSDPIGEEINVGPLRCKIVGVLEEVGSAMGSNPDQVAIVPVSTAIKYWPWLKWRMGINVEAYPDYNADAQDEVITVLRSLRSLAPYQANNFSIITQEMMKELFDKITGAAAFVVIFIAAISLVVAGIGIMNVMYVTVKERTREIGIRKACGATSNAILLQFSAEAALLSSIGGLLGILTVGLLVITVSKFLPFDLIFPPWLMILGLMFSFTVGVIFGVIPARKASRMKVVESLRYE